MAKKDKVKHRTGVGTVLLVCGLCFYAKAKGDHPAWGLLGVLSLIGEVILALLKDRSPMGSAAFGHPPQWGLSSLPTDGV